MLPQTLITDLTKTSGIPFFFIANFNIFLGTLSKAFSRSTKHKYNFFFFSMILFLHPSQDKYNINCTSLRHKVKLQKKNTNAITLSLTLLLLPPFCTANPSPYLQHKELQLISPQLSLYPPQLISPSLHPHHRSTMTSPSHLLHTSTILSSFITNFSLSTHLNSIKISIISNYLNSMSQPTPQSAHQASQDTASYTCTLQVAPRGGR